MPDRASATEARVREHAERNLSALVITVEFTLISVMIGVILFPLMDFSTALVRDMRIEYWLYIFSGLLFILYLWTEVISHSLSFVGWPIDIGHNLLYIVFALSLGIQMHFLAEPYGWYAFSLVSAIIATATIIYDQYVIQQHLVSAPAGATADLFRMALDRQRGLVRTTPFTIGNAVFQLALVVLLPGFFIENRGHLILVAIQILALLGLLIRTIRTFQSWGEPIVRKAMQELLSEGDR